MRMSVMTRQQAREAITERAFPARVLAVRVHSVRGKRTGIVRQVIAPRAFMLLLFRIGLGALLRRGGGIFVECCGSSGMRDDAVFGVTPEDGGGMRGEGTGLADASDIALRPMLHYGDGCFARSALTVNKVERRELIVSKDLHSVK